MNDRTPHTFFDLYYAAYVPFANVCPGTRREQPEESPPQHAGFGRFAAGAVAGLLLGLLLGGLPPGLTH